MSDFILDSGAYLDYRRFLAIPMTSNSTSVWDVRFQDNCNTAVGVWKKR